MAANPAPAVVVATHNRPDGLRRCMTALAAQDLPPAEIILVDDGSTPPAKVPPELAGGAVTLLRNERAGGPAAARNRGWRATTSDYVLFTDDDCRPSPGWVAAMAAGAAPDAVLVGRTLPDPADGPEASPLDRSMHVESCDGSFPTCNIAYPRALLERLGGFDETFRSPYGEDTDLGQRALAAGGRGAYVPEALVHHAVHHQTLRAAVAERRRLAELARLARVHPQLRASPWDGHFWNSDHRLLLDAAIAAAGLPAALAGSTRGARHPYRAALGLASAAAAAAPALKYAYFCRRRSRALAGDAGWRGAATWAMLDAAEMAMLAAGSVRHRSLLL
jgi:GT2 family glycosyltransferase